LIARVAFAAYTAAVATAIVVAYPELASREPGPSPSARRAQPPPRLPMGPGVAVSALGRPTSQYRGDPTHTGTTPEIVSTALAVAWEAKPANVGIHGASKGSPAIDDTGLYVGTDGGSLLHLSANGEVLWTFKVGHAVNGIHGTPLLDEAAAYVGAYNGELYALDKQDGFPRWTIKLGDAIGSSPVPWGDDLLIAVEVSQPPDGYVARVKRATGELVWRSAWLGEQAHSSVSIHAASGTAMVGANNHTFTGLVLETGALSFRFRGDGAVKDTACVVGQTSYFTTRTGSLVALDARSGETRFRTKLGTVTRSSPSDVPGSGIVVVAASETNAGTGRIASVLGVDGLTGAVRWRHATGSDDSAASALVAKGLDDRWNAWIRCGDDGLCAFDAITGELRARVAVGAPLTGVPVAYRGSLYLSLDAPGGVVRLDPAPPSLPANP
jgi:outer membrane protein assembly factor BamB